MATKEEERRPTAGLVAWTKAGLAIHVWKQGGHLYAQTTLRGSLPDPTGVWNGPFVGASNLVRWLRAEMAEE